MDQKTHSQKFLRHRKFMLVLPALVLPFVTLLFWSFGGRESAGSTDDSAILKGLNTQLPDAVIRNEQSLTKMSFYDQAAADSVKKAEMMKTDPFYQLNSSNQRGMQDSVTVIKALSGSLETGCNISTSPDPNEAKVYSRIEALNKAMDQASSRSVDKANGYSSSAPPPVSAMKSADVDRLEQMMNMVKSSKGEDPEMEQLDGMLDKIMDIQHPERVSEQAPFPSMQTIPKVVPVSSREAESKISLLQSELSNSERNDTVLRSSQSAFYSLDQVDRVSLPQNSITAVIHETQNLVSGATVKMRLLSDISINGILIPKDNFVYGTATLSDERLKITIASLRYRNSIFPVKLEVYDLDGMEGIFIPGSISRDVVKTSADQAFQGIGISTLSPTLPLQAAGAGIQAAKSLLSKKARLVKVSVKADYQVLLRGADQ